MTTTFSHGQKVQVLTYGLANRWNDAAFCGHQEASPTQREVFFFSGRDGCYGVLAQDLAARVRAV